MGVTHSGWVISWINRTVSGSAWIKSDSFSFWKNKSSWHCSLTAPVPCCFMGNLSHLEWGTERLKPGNKSLLLWKMYAANYLRIFLGRYKVILVFNSKILITATVILISKNQLYIMSLHQSKSTEIKLSESSVINTLSYIPFPFSLLCFHLSLHPILN